MKRKKGILRIGTSNIALPGSKETFPPQFRDKSRLHYYSTLFNTLEVNSTFKKIPQRSTLERWSHDVPADFVFSIKVWQDITHVKQLNINPQNIEAFVSAVDYTASSKGCLLIQFPGDITYDYFEKVNDLLKTLNAADSANTWRKAVEFRSSTWYHPETYKMLDNLDACLVLHDMPKSKILQHEDRVPFAYFRFHGPKGDYRGSYSNEFLMEQAENIRGLLTQGKDVYAYFNNTMGSAYENAMHLKSSIRGKMQGFED